MDFSYIQLEKVGLFRKDYRIAKRVIDIVIPILAFPIVIPIIVVCAILIWLDDPGPIFFRHLRTGKGGRRFEIYRFRTMVANVERLKERTRNFKGSARPTGTVNDDPRLTRVGRFLRKSGLDDLPQIFNVLKGDMSLVGPRLTPCDANTQSLPYAERLEVLPGITGLWQVSGRSDVDSDERLLLDIEYIENQSLWLDMKILIRTVLMVFRREGTCC